MHPFKSICYAASAPGPRLIVLGAVHGNETCGTQAITRLTQEFDAAKHVLAKGQLTLVPVTNAKAYALNRRNGDRNLNRNLAPTDTPREFEDHVANWLCPMLHAHDVLLDLHSFQAAGGQPFVMVGPQDNDDVLEPFAHAQAERAWAQQLGVRRAVDGWLSTYAAGVARRAQDLEAAKLPTAHLNLSAIYGVGTTEYMRCHGAQDKGNKGGLALTLECGQHADPHAPQVAYDAILNTLAHFGMLQGAAAPAAQRMEGLRMYEVIDKAHEADAFARAWASFDALRAGDVIGTRASGAVVKAPHDGYILFPNALAQPGQEWFYLAKSSTRFA